MTSEAKCTANRQNAQRSTGPRTAQGKRRVSRNAHRHGLTASLNEDTHVHERVKQIASAILSCSPVRTAAASSLALDAAEAQSRLDLIKAHQLTLYGAIGLPSRDDDCGTIAAAVVQLSRLDRYLGRAMSQRREAILGLLRLCIEVQPR